MNSSYKEHRCPKCRKLLFKGVLRDTGSVVEIKCRGCGEIGTFSGISRADLPEIYREQAE